MEKCVSVIIPAYKVERQIENVINEIPSRVKYVIVVDDASPDKT